MPMRRAKELQEQGVQLFQKREYEAAAKVFDQAKQAYLEADDDIMASEMKVNIALVHRELGEKQQALDLMQEALKFFKDKNDQLRIAQVLGNMGGVYLALQDKEQAAMAYREAADIFIELGEKELYADTLLALGNLQVREGKFVAGASLYQVGLGDKQQLNFRQRFMKRLSGFITSMTVF